MNKKGFTLIEILAVIVILGLLMVLVIPKVNSVINDSKKNVTLNSVKSLVKGFNEYYVRKKIKNNFDGCTYYFDTKENDCEGFEFEGIEPDFGEIFVSKNGEISGFVVFDGQRYDVFDSEVLLGESDYSNDSVFRFAFTNKVQNFVVSRNGYYKLEVWGAQGGIGGFSSEAIAGRGAYAKGVLYLEKGTKLYVYVGGQGVGQTGDVSDNNVNLGGFNGGGNNYNSGGQASSGGGASDIRINTDSLYARVIVAGGGGGNGYGSNENVGGSAGTLTGFNGGFFSEFNYYGYGAGDFQGGSFYGSNSANGYSNTAGSFGIGGIGVGNSHGGGSGGGGFYGGGGGFISAGGGGSSFVYTMENYNSWLSKNSSDASKYMLDSRYYLLDSVMIDGESTMPGYESETKMIGNYGNGYAKIEFIGINYRGDL